jgi:hypothetical protein
MTCILLPYLRYQTCIGTYVEFPMLPVFPHPDKYRRDIPPVINNLKFEWGSYQKEREQRKT